MSMTPELWSISGLSVELGIDRRTLNKRLSGLRPDAERREAGKTVKRWRLARVLRHLDLQSRGNGQSQASNHLLVLLNQDAELVCRHLYPSILSSRYFRGLTINYLRQDLGAQR